MGKTPLGQYVSDLINNLYQQSPVGPPAPLAQTARPGGQYLAEQARYQPNAVTQAEWDRSAGERRRYLETGKERWGRGFDLGAHIEPWKQDILNVGSDISALWNENDFKLGRTLVDVGKAVLEPSIIPLRITGDAFETGTQYFTDQVYSKAIYEYVTTGKEPGWLDWGLTSLPLGTMDAGGGGFRIRELVAWDDKNGLKQYLDNPAVQERIKTAYNNDGYAGIWEDVLMADAEWPIRLLVSTVGDPAFMGTLVGGEFGGVLKGASAARQARTGATLATRAMRLTGEALQVPTRLDDAATLLPLRGTKLAGKGVGKAAQKVAPDQADWIARRASRMFGPTRNSIYRLTGRMTQDAEGALGKVRDWQQGQGNPGAGVFPTPPGGGTPGAPAGTAPTPGGGLPGAPGGAAPTPGPGSGPSGTVPGGSPTNPGTPPGGQPRVPTPPAPEPSTVTGAGARLLKLLDNGLPSLSRASGNLNKGMVDGLNPGIPPTDKNLDRPYISYIKELAKRHPDRFDRIAARLLPSFERYAQALINPNTTKELRQIERSRLGLSILAVVSDEGISLPYRLNKQLLYEQARRDYAIEAIFEAAILDADPDRRMRALKLLLDLKAIDYRDPSAIADLVRRAAGTDIANGIEGFFVRRETVDRIAVRVSPDLATYIARMKGKNGRGIPSVVNIAIEAITGDKRLKAGVGFVPNSFLIQIQGTPDMDIVADLIQQDRALARQYYDELVDLGVIPNPATGAAPTAPTAPTPGPQTPPPSSGPAPQSPTPPSNQPSATGPLYQQQLADRQAALKAAQDANILDDIRAMMSQGKSINYIQSALKNRLRKRPAAIAFVRTILDPQPSGVRYGFSSVDELYLAVADTAHPGHIEGNSILNVAEGRFVELVYEALRQEARNAAPGAGTIPTPPPSAAPNPPTSAAPEPPASAAPTPQAPTPQPPTSAAPNPPTAAAPQPQPQPESPLVDDSEMPEPTGQAAPGPAPDPMTQEQFEARQAQIRNELEEKYNEAVKLNIASNIEELAARGFGLDEIVDMLPIPGAKMFDQFRFVDQVLGYIGVPLLDTPEFSAWQDDFWPLVGELDWPKRKTFDEVPPIHRWHEDRAEQAMFDAENTIGDATDALQSPLGPSNRRMFAAINEPEFEQYVELWVDYFRRKAKHVELGGLPENEHKALRILQNKLNTSDKYIKDYLKTAHLRANPGRIFSSIDKTLLKNMAIAEAEYRIGRELGIARRVDLITYTGQSLDAIKRLPNTVEVPASAASDAPSSAKPKKEPTFKWPKGKFKQKPLIEGDGQVTVRITPDEWRLFLQAATTDQRIRPSQRQQQRDASLLPVVEKELRDALIFREDLDTAGSWSIKGYPLRTGIKADRISMPFGESPGITFVNAQEWVGTEKWQIKDGTEFSKDPNDPFRGFIQGMSRDGKAFPFYVILDDDVARRVINGEIKQVSAADKRFIRTFRSYADARRFFEAEFEKLRSRYNIIPPEGAAFPSASEPWITPDAPAAPEVPAAPDAPAADLGPLPQIDEQRLSTILNDWNEYSAKYRTWVKNRDNIAVKVKSGWEVGDLRVRRLKPEEIPAGKKRNAVHYGVIDPSGKVLKSDSSSYVAIRYAVDLIRDRENSLITINRAAFLRGPAETDTMIGFLTPTSLRSLELTLPEGSTISFNGKSYPIGSMNFDNVEAVGAEYDRLGPIAAEERKAYIAAKFGREDVLSPTPPVEEPSLSAAKPDIPPVAAAPIEQPVDYLAGEGDWTPTGASLAPAADDANGLAQAVGDRIDEIIRTMPRDAQPSQEQLQAVWDALDDYVNNVLPLLTRDEERYWDRIFQNYMQTYGYNTRPRVSASKRVTQGIAKQSAEDLIRTIEVSISRMQSGQRDEVATNEAIREYINEYIRSVRDNLSEDQRKEFDRIFDQYARVGAQPPKSTAPDLKSTPPIKQAQPSAPSQEGTWTIGSREVPPPPPPRRTPEDTPTFNVPKTFGSQQNSRIKMKKIYKRITLNDPRPREYGTTVFVTDRVIEADLGYLNKKNAVEYFTTAQAKKLPIWRVIKGYGDDAVRQSGLTYDEAVKAAQDDLLEEYDRAVKQTEEAIARRAAETAPKFQRTMPEKQAIYAAEDLDTELRKLTQGVRLQGKTLAPDAAQRVQEGVNDYYGRIRPNLSAKEQNRYDIIFSVHANSLRKKPSSGAVYFVNPQAKAFTDMVFNWLDGKSNPRLADVIEIPERHIIDAAFNAGVITNLEHKLLTETMVKLPMGGEMTLWQYWVHALHHTGEDLYFLGGGPAGWAPKYSRQMVQEALFDMKYTPSQVSAFMRAINKFDEKFYTPFIDWARHTRMHNIISGPSKVLADLVGDSYTGAVLAGEPEAMARALPGTELNRTMNRVLTGQADVTDLWGADLFTRTGAKIPYNDQVANQTAYLTNQTVQQIMAAANEPLFKDAAGNFSKKKAANFILQNPIVIRSRTQLEQSRRYSLQWSVYQREINNARAQFLNQAREIAQAEGLDPDLVVRTLQDELGDYFSAMDVMRVMNNSPVFGNLRAGQKTRLQRNWAQAVSNASETARKTEARYFFTYEGNNADELLRHAFLFHYFFTRWIGMHARATLGNPWLAYNYTRIWHGLEKQAELNGQPPTVAGTFRYLGSSTGINHLFNPLAMVVPLETFRALSELEGEVGFMDVIKSFMIMQPIVDAAYGVLGGEWGKSTPDVFGVRQITNFVTAALNFAAANGIAPGATAMLANGTARKNLEERIINSIVDNGNRAMQQFGLPFDYDRYDPSQGQMAMMHDVVVRRLVEKYGPPEDQYGNNLWSEEAWAEYTGAITALDTGGNNNKLAEEAYREVANGKMSNEIFELALGYSQMRSGFTDSLNTTIRKGGPKAGQAIATKGLSQTGSAADARFTAAKAQYDAMGTERQRKIADMYTTISFGNLKPTEGVLVMGMYINGATLAKMSAEDRSALAWAYVGEQGGRDELTQYWDQRKAFVAKNPIMAKWSDYFKSQTASGDFATTQAWREELARRNTNYAAEMQNERNRLAGDGIQGEMLEQRLDQWALGSRGYLAWMGVQNNIWADKPVSTNGAVLPGEDIKAEAFEKKSSFTAALDAVQGAAYDYKDKIKNANQRLQYYGYGYVDFYSLTDPAMIAQLRQFLGPDYPEPSMTLRLYWTWAAQQRAKGLPYSQEAYADWMSRAGGVLPAAA